MRRHGLTIAAALFAFLALICRGHAQDRSVVLNLNDAGAQGLERLLDVARRNATTWNDVDMAVSLYHAVEQARQVAAAQAQKAADAVEIEKLKAALKAAQDAAQKPTEQQP